MENAEVFEVALRNVIKELKAPKGQWNDFGKYNYRNAEDILEAVKPLLEKEGLRMSISDTVVNLGDRYYVKATVSVSKDKTYVSVDGWAREAETVKGMQDSQVTGSTSSYARKYALNGMFCIDDTKDADSMDNSRTEKKLTGVGANRTSQDSEPATPEQKQGIAALLALQGIQTQDMPDVLEKEFNVPTGSVMTFKQAETILKDLQENKEPF